MNAFDTKEHGKASNSSSERPSGKGDMAAGVKRLEDNMREPRESLDRTNLPRSRGDKE